MMGNVWTYSFIRSSCFKTCLQGACESGREDVQFASFGSVPTGVLAATRANEHRLVERDDQPFLRSLGSVQNAALAGSYPQHSSNILKGDVVLDRAPNQSGSQGMPGSTAEVPRMQGTNLFSHAVPQVAGPALMANRGFAAPHELQSFLLSVITLLGQVENQSLPLHQLIAEASSLKSHVRRPILDLHLYLPVLPCFVKATGLATCNIWTCIETR